MVMKVQWRRECAKPWELLVLIAHAVAHNAIVKR